MDGVPAPQGSRFVHDLQGNPDARTGQRFHRILGCLPAEGPIQSPLGIVSRPSEAVIARGNNVKTVILGPLNSGGDRLVLRCFPVGIRRGGATRIQIETKSESVQCGPPGFGKDDVGLHRRCVEAKGRYWKNRIAGLVRIQELTAAGKVWDIEAVSYRDIHFGSLAAIPENDGSKTSVAGLDQPSAGNVSDFRIVATVNGGAACARGIVGE